jgi:Ca-activated chloride channel family protein
VILLVTDGEDFAGGLEEVRAELGRKGVILYAVGMGTGGGSPIPELDETGRRRGFVRDREGSVVMSRLEEAPLIELATTTGGVYARAGATGLDIDRLTAELGALQGRTYGAQRITSYRERYLWPLGAALILLIAEGLLHDRRRRA